MALGAGGQVTKPQPLGAGALGQRPAGAGGSSVARSAACTCPECMFLEEASLDCSRWQSLCALAWHTRRQTEVFLNSFP